MSTYGISTLFFISPLPLLGGNKTHGPIIIIINLSSLKVRRPPVGYRPFSGSLEEPVNVIWTTCLKRKHLRGRIFLSMIKYDLRNDQIEEKKYFTKKRTTEKNQCIHSLDNRVLYSLQLRISEEATSVLT